MANAMSVVGFKSDGNLLPELNCTARVRAGRANASYTRGNLMAEPDAQAFLRSRGRIGDSVYGNLYSIRMTARKGTGTTLRAGSSAGFANDNIPCLDRSSQENKKKWPKSVLT